MNHMRTGPSKVAPLTCAVCEAFLTWLWHWPATGWSAARCTERREVSTAWHHHPPLLLMQVTAAEGFGKTRLFEILDDLEEKTRPIMEAARARLAQEKGASALDPHNMGYALAGEANRGQVSPALQGARGG